jgi:monofunctional biosynthetic peptidoglycan transglycosylase
MTAVVENSTAPPRSGPRPWGRTLRKGLVLVVALALAFVLIPYALAPLYRVVDPVSTLMLWHWVRGTPVVRTWTPIGRIAPALPRAVIAAEDGQFCRHHGVDFGELRAIVRSEMRGAQKPRGGSGLTQQLAKNLFLWPGRSYVRKALELPLALWIDLVVPKRRQLEIYLNVVQWGPGGEFGAEAAARHAFGKPAAALSAQDAAMLAAMLPNPVTRDPRHAGPGLHRLAGIIAARSAIDYEFDRCVAGTRPAR